MRQPSSGYRSNRPSQRTAPTSAHRRHALAMALEPFEPRRLLSALSITPIPFTGINSNGANSASGLIMDSNGNLFGTTANGGTHGNGTVFEIPAGTHTITVLANFNSPTTGGSPRGQIAIDAQGNLYGDTFLGGANNEGTVWKVAQGSNAVTVLANLTNATGFQALGGVTLDAQGDIFGTTTEGGLNTVGTIFEIPKSTGIISAIFSFNDNFIDGADPSANLANDNGANPAGSLFIDSQGDLFGTAGTGGTNGLVDLDVGTLWELSASTGFSVLSPFNFDGSTGVFPSTGVVMDSSGDIFGVTDQTSNNGGDGVVYELAHGTSNITILASFNGTNGQHPTDLIIDSHGNLFGMTDGDQKLDGGDDGTIFEIPAGTTTINTLFSFNGTDGLEPEGNLVMDANGNFYGTTLGGGPNNDSPGGDGVVFELSSASAPTHLAISSAPTTGVTGQTLSSVTVAVEDANNNIVTSDNSNITLTLHGGAAGATLGGATTVAAVNGVATFTNLSISAAATGYTLSAADGALAGGPSAPITITAPGGAAGLTPTIVSTSLPASIVAGAKFKGSININVTNPSATAEKGFTIDVFASTDKILSTPDDKLVIGVHESATINAKKTSPFSIQLTTLPAGLPNGAYFLIVETIDAAGNKKTVSTNTRITVAAPNVALTETVTSTLPASLISGAPVKGTITVTITNHGNVAGTGPTPIKVTASTTAGTPGTHIVSQSNSLNLPIGVPVKVTFQITSLPALAAGRYFFVAQVTEPLHHTTTIATSAARTTIAAPVISLISSLAAVANINAGDILTLTNNGNIDDKSTFHFTLGFSLDHAGTEIVGLTSHETQSTTLKTHVPAKIHFNDWSKILTGLANNVPYFLTLTTTDTTGHTTTAISPNSFLL